MEAFSNGVRLGGLYDTQEIKILICYMLMGVSEPLHRDSIVQILSYNEIANLFETSAAIDDLVKLENLTEDENGMLSMTDKGAALAKQLFTMVPYTLREQALGAAVQTLARAQRLKETKITIEELDSGYSITCAVDNAEHPMMAFTLRVADRMQAETIRNRFLDDPLTVYRMLVSVMTGCGEMTEEKGRIHLTMPL